MIINKDLIISDTSKSLNDVTNYIDGQGVILYENSTAQANTTITLSDSFLNYDHIIIEWKARGYTDYFNHYQTMVSKPVNNRAYCVPSAFYNHTNNQIYAVCTYYKIKENNKIEIGNSGSSQAGTVGASNAYTANPGVWGIIRVIGYK
jgi:hypothetical protein